MATPGKLIDITAQALGLSPATVGQYYRSLREEGAVTRGGRGRSAPQSTYLDASRLLIAILASDTAFHAHQESTRFWTLKNIFWSAPVDPYRGLDRQMIRSADFDHALAYVLSILGSDWRRPSEGDILSATTAVRSDGYCEIAFADNLWTFGEPPEDWSPDLGSGLLAAPVPLPVKVSSGVVIQRTIVGRSLGLIAAELGPTALM
jgi:hypothetical protein